MDKEKEIRIIEQGSEDARLVSKAMASSTASELLDALSECPKSASELEAETGYPLPTIQYHMGNLLNAGLVQIHTIRYSEKGKPMKLYAVSDTILVISPKKKNEEEVRPVLRKYGFTAAGFMIAVSAASVICSGVLKVSVDHQEYEPAPNLVALRTVEIPEAMPVSDMAYMAGSDAVSSGGTADILLSQINVGMLIFLIVSLLILAGLLVFELIRIKKNKP